MSEITVYMRDGDIRVFPETSRTGGSYCTTGKHSLGWYTITDAWGKVTEIPAATIAYVNVDNGRSW